MSGESTEEYRAALTEDISKLQSVLEEKIGKAPETFTYPYGKISPEAEAALKDMGFVCPFKGFTDEFLPENPLIRAANEYVAKGFTPVDWCFTTMPSEDWKNGVGSALLEYAQGTGNWDAVKTAFVDGWATEMAAAKG